MLISFCLQGTQDLLRVLAQLRWSGHFWLRYASEAGYRANGLEGAAVGMRPWRSRLAEGEANDRTGVRRVAGGSGVAVRAGGRTGCAADASEDQAAETHGSTSS